MFPGQGEHLGFLEPSKRGQQSYNTATLDIEQRLPGSQPLRGAIRVRRPCVHTDRDREPRSTCLRSSYEKVVSARYLPFQRNRHADYCRLLPLEPVVRRERSACGALGGSRRLAVVNPQRLRKPFVAQKKGCDQRAVDTPA